MTAPLERGDSISEERRRCIALCAACRDACLAQAQASTEGPGDAKMASLAALLRSCAAQCDRTIQAIEQDRGVSDAVSACAEITSQCTRELAALTNDQPALLPLLDACRECAAQCIKVATPAVPYDESVIETFPASDPPAH